MFDKKLLNQQRLKLCVHPVSMKIVGKSVPEDIKNPFTIQMSMKFLRLINVEMPTDVVVWPMEFPLKYH